MHGNDLIGALRRVGAGESLLDPALTARVLDRLRNPEPSTDPLAGIDIPHMLRDSGDALLDTARDGDVITFTIRKYGPGHPPG